jgi:two-component system cell cycle sensor histidine kinase/response regulator CckA
MRWETGKGQVAIELVAEHRNTVHLLLYDIVMPQTSGVRLFNLLKQSAPDLKVIFMSGHGTEMPGRHHPLPPEAAFIEKHFAEDSLLSTIWIVLGERTGS